MSTLLYLIARAQADKEPTLTSVVSESLPHLKKGAMRDFLLILQTHKYFKDDRWNRSDFRYTFETGSVIEFFSADQPSKVRGPRRDRLFINEANNIDFESFDQLEVRTKEFVIMDWNPVAEFFFNTDILGKRTDVEHIILTYKDNEALPSSIRDSIEQRRGNERWWRVYGLGLLGESEGRIFTGWNIIDSVPPEARLERRGLDFGYTCLSGETLIATAEGERRIDTIKPGDFVLTRKGFKRVLNSWSNGVKDVLEVDFGYGKRIIMTGDHRVYTLDGWKRADQLNRNEIICERILNSTEESTEDTQTEKEKTTSPIRECQEASLKRASCIGIYTKSFLGRSQMALSSIIKMATRLTTTHLTWLHCRLVSIFPSTTTSAIGVSAHCPKSNYKQSMISTASAAKTGTSAGLRAWEQPGERSSGARSVVRVLSRLATSIRNIVARFAGKKRTHGIACANTHAKTAKLYLSHQPTSKETHALKSVRIHSRRLKRAREVFDLEVEGEHEFFANGVLVHNCDPSALVAVYKYNGGYIVDEELYLKGMSNKALADRILLTDKPMTLVVADSSEPKSIDEIKLYGVNIIGADKGRGSVSQGIQFIQDQNISITKRSVNGIKEYRSYSWIKDKEGKQLNVPEGGFDHFLDSLRYAMSSLSPVETKIDTSFVHEEPETMYNEIGI